MTLPVGCNGEGLNFRGQMVVSLRWSTVSAASDFLGAQKVTKNAPQTWPYPSMGPRLVDILSHRTKVPGPSFFHPGF